MPAYSFFNRDTSWLSFNERILQEAAKPTVPLLERIKFLSIYSSNLDEFYRVRMPVLKALDKLNHTKDAEISKDAVTGDTIQQLVHRQQQLFGSILTQQLLPQFQQQRIHLVYNEPIPAAISTQVATYFYTRLAAFIEVIAARKAKDFFPENNKLYITVLLQQKDGEEEMVFVNIPSDAVPRFYTVSAGGTHYILFIDDIIREHLPALFTKATINGVYSIKITRDAELNIADEYQGDIAEKIEKQIAKRDFGLATRFLYQPGMPLRTLNAIAGLFALADASMMEGGAYHNLKDFIGLPVADPALSYPSVKPLDYPLPTPGISLFEAIQQKDILVHTPYQRYDTILRFFNEAAIDERTEEIYTTLYRVASDSMIVHALISAARNGKKVTVFVELQARFDEANNIKWAKNMKAAGVRILYSIPGLKVHAKVALVKKKQGGRVVYTGLFATGNLNESTARFYTDHILLTAKHSLLRELELLFLFLVERKKPKEKDAIRFEHLLIAQFNLQQQFIQLIDREISNAQQGLPAGIIIKLNNLEEQVLIGKLYEASAAGVTIQLIVRSICCLIPGVKGMSEHITVRRIVDKYLEHGRAFIFHNNGNEEVYLGSSDWMNRNIYHRIEVCFPIEDPLLKKEIRHIIDLQLQDNSQAVIIDNALSNTTIPVTGEMIRSQEAIYTYLRDKSK
ncbi:polyphosphate kinase 1 [Russula earlei]|uniref:Polyphosphate kinase 1 n=1 Tax=Russula earlei TaxID=71964 RepID=A0ACC0TV31_9AGAM|nr:polyphosphate kinase 1 [Russula earlei]